MLNNLGDILAKKMERVLDEALSQTIVYTIAEFRDKHHFDITTKEVKRVIECELSKSQDSVKEVMAAPGRGPSRIRLFANRIEYKKALRDAIKELRQNGADTVTQEEIAAVLARKMQNEKFHVRQLRRLNKELRVNWKAFLEEDKFTE